VIMHYFSPFLPFGGVRNSFKGHRKRKRALWLSGLL